MRVNTFEEAKTVLSTGMKTSLLLWYAGTDLKCLYPDRTFRRHRKEVMSVTGIDLALPYSDQDACAGKVLLGIDELMGREVKEIPQRIQRSLFGAGV